MLEEVDSTNRYAESLLKSSPPDGTVVMAHQQTAGRGQAGNAWFSQPGQNLTLSLILYPLFLQVSQAFVLNKLVSLALLDTLKHFLPKASLKIKWPNDLLADKLKISGILIQNQLAGSMIRNSVIGIGLNVNQVIFPAEIREKATSMKLFSGHEFDLKQVLGTLMTHLEREYLRLKSSGPARLDRAYLDHLYAYQEMHRFRIRGEVMEGMIVGVEKEGKLAVQLNREVLHLNLKEIEFLL